MTDAEYAEYAEQRARVERLLHKWTGPLGLRYWSLKVHMHRAPKEGAPETDATCGTSWQYFEVRFDFYLPNCAQLSDDDLEWVVVHECVHALTEEMASLRGAEENEHTDRQVERVVSQLAKAFIWVHQLTADGTMTDPEPEEGAA